MKSFGTLRVSLLLLTGVLIFYSGKPIQAQGRGPEINHNHSDAIKTLQDVADGMIDGAQHPELIPDSTAYRLYLLSVSVPSTASEADRRIQTALLRKAALDENDLQSTIAVLAVFRSQYEAWLTKYNTVAAAQGAAFDPTPFLQQSVLTRQLVRF